jgi:AcrR family transcriptional regulator/predicted DNA-binding transcriptional regulator AlpA
MQYEFELRFKIPADGPDVERVVERLGEAGCNDALVGIGQPGRIALKFTREAQSAKQAIVSALEDVKKAVPAAKLIEAGPDFVGLTDVAELLGVSRQNVRKLMLTHAASFPAPVHEGSAAIWHLEPVLQWLRSKGGYNISEPQIDVAHISMQINLIKAVERLELRMQREVRSLLA